MYRKCDRCPLTFHTMSLWEHGVETVLDGRIRAHRRGNLGGITLNAVGVKVGTAVVVMNFWVAGGKRYMARVKVGT